MTIDVEQASPEVVRPWRDMYRHEMNCQIVRDSWFERGFTDAYQLRLNGKLVGYGLVGGPPREPRESVVEFYVLPDQRGSALPLFRALVAASHARSAYAQTNDVLLTLMLFDSANRIESHTILFHDAWPTALAVPGAVFRSIDPAEKDSVFGHQVEPVGDWAIEVGSEIVATGGVMGHYNPPFGDLYMEVAEPHRRRGYGSYLVQELKRTASEMGKTPAARCNADNVVSRATLQKAGLLPCGRVLFGQIGE